MRMLSA